MDYSQRLNELNNDRKNGLIDILNVKPRASFELFQQNTNGNELFSQEAIQHTITETPLNCAFFSKNNIDHIQNTIINEIYRLSDNKFVIGRQSDTELKIIMRSIYMQYGKNLSYNIKQQISELNKRVLDYCIPSVFNEAVGYEKYCRDQSTLVVPLELPKHVDREYKQNELHRWV